MSQRNAVFIIENRKAVVTTNFLVFPFQISTRKPKYFKASKSSIGGKILEEIMHIQVSHINSSLNGKASQHKHLDVGK